MRAGRGIVGLLSSWGSATNVLESGVKRGSRGVNRLHESAAAHHRVDHVPVTSATDFVMKRVARDEAPAQQGLAAAKVPDRKAEQVKKNLEVQAKQPPSMKDVGLDSDKLGEKAMPNVAQMTLEEFNALPATTKARLRGDML